MHFVRCKGEILTNPRRTLCFISTSSQCHLDIVILTKKPIKNKSKDKKKDEKALQKINKTENTFFKNKNKHINIRGKKKKKKTQKTGTKQKHEQNNYKNKSLQNQEKI